MKNKKLILLIICCLLLGAGVGSFSNMTVQNLLLIGSGDKLIAISNNSISWVNDGTIKMQFVYMDGVLRVINGEGETIQAWTE
ncbi:MAG: hypothetical protein QQN63_12425 [Nitrosopumilus sp.]